MECGVELTAVKDIGMQRMNRIAKCKHSTHLLLIMLPVMWTTVGRVARTGLCAWLPGLPVLVSIYCIQRAAPRNKFNLCCDGVHRQGNLHDCINEYGGMATAHGMTTQT